MQFAPPAQPDGGEWVNIQQAHPVPSGAAFMRVYVGFIANDADEHVYVDALTIQRASVFVAPIFATAPEGRPRIEVVPSNDVQMRWWPSDSPLDEPGVIKAEKASMTIQPPRNVASGVPSSLVLAVDRLDFRQFGSSAWTPWTPSVRSSGPGTNWALGNGTITGRWVKIGTTVWFSFFIDWGTTSVFGVNPLRITLPFGRAAGTRAVGSWVAEDTNLGGYHQGAIAVRDTPTLTGQEARLVTPGFGGGVIDTVPFTWADADFLYGSVTYEAGGSGVVPY